MSGYRDRHEVAGTTAVVVALLLPFIALVLLLVTAWMWVLGVGGDDLHATLWGWLSTRKRDGTWAIGKVPIGWETGVIAAYLLYQFGELVAFGFRTFAARLRHR